MKAKLRITEMNGKYSQSFILEGQNIPLLPGENIIFSVEDEGPATELPSKLKNEAKKEADSRGITIPGL